MNVDEAAWQIVARGLLGRNRPDANDAVRQLMQGAESLWPQVIHLADTNFVSPGLWKALADRGLDRYVPADPAQYLGAMYEMNQARNAALETQLDELIRACNSAGITPGLIKGASHLKTGLYGDHGLRLMTDLDLLIQPGQLDDAVRVLEALGYAPLPDPHTDEDDHHHLPAYFRRGDYGSIEVHREPMNLEARPCLQAAELWDDSTEYRDDGLRYRVPSPTHNMLVAIVHSEVADRNLRKLFISLRALQDVVAMILNCGDLVDWRSIQQRMHREGHGGVFRDFLYTLNRLSDEQPLPELRFGLRSRSRYLACRLALRHSAVRPWLVRFNDLSAYRIGQRFGARQSFLSRNINRLRVVASFIARQFRSARNER